MSTATAAPAAPPSHQRPRAEILRRADGIELVGHFKDSGFRETHKLARRSDGQVVQLSELLYTVAEAADGRRDLVEVAQVVSQRSQRTVTANDVAYLANRKLRPLGVLTLPDGTTPELKKREPVMALRHRRPLLSERTVNAGARLFTWLHVPVVKLVLMLTIGVFDAWLFALHGIAGGMRSAIYNPTLLLAVLASVVVATAFHEFGHASACRYSGGRPGVMGIGLYLVWPAFYCDVTDAYRLNRRGRLRTDLGGVYFNAIFALLAGGVFFATGEEAALLAAVVQHIILLQQLLPLMRFDGYYVLTDLTGVPDILSRIKPIFRSLIRGRKSEPRVAELKPWVRVVVTAYLLILIPALTFLVVWMTLGFPRLVATVYDSFGLQLDRIQAAADPSEIALGFVRIVTLVLPVAGTTLSLSRVGRMVGRGATRWSSGSMPRKVVAAVGAAVLIGAVAYTWWPNGDYEPIRSGERGTIGEAIDAIPHAPGGRAAFTPARAAVYERVPTERQSDADRRGGRSAGTGSDSMRTTPGDGADELGTGDTETLSGAGDESWPDGSDESWLDGPDPYTPEETTTDTSSPTSDTGTTTTGTGTTPTDTGTTPTDPGTTPTDTGTTTTDTGTTPTDTTTAPTTSDITPTSTTTTPTTTDTGTSTSPTNTTTTTGTTTAPTETSTPTTDTTTTPTATDTTTTPTGTSTTGTDTSAAPAPPPTDTTSTT